MSNPKMWRLSALAAMFALAGVAVPTQANCDNNLGDPNDTQADDSFIGYMNEVAGGDDTYFDDAIGKLTDAPDDDFSHEENVVDCVVPPN